MYDFTPVTNVVISSSRMCLFSCSQLSNMEDLTPVTNGVIYYSRLSYMYVFYASN